MAVETQSAMSRVLSNPELVENILLHLTMRDLLINAPLVNHLFHATIASSLRIQQILYFAPSYDTNVPVSVPNPLINASMPLPIFKDRRIKRTDFTCLPGSITPRSGSWPASAVTADMPTLPRIIFWHETPDRMTEKWTRPEASWRRMLLIQPAINELKYGDGSWDTAYGLYKSDNGVRLGMLEKEMHCFRAVSSFIIFTDGRGHLLEPGDY